MQYCSQDVANSLSVRDLGLSGPLSIDVCLSVRQLPTVLHWWRRSSSGGRREYRFNPFVQWKMQRARTSRHARAELQYASCARVWRIAVDLLSNCLPILSQLYWLRMRLFASPPSGVPPGASETLQMVCRRPHPSNSVPLASLALC